MKFRYKKIKLKSDHIMQQNASLHLKKIKTNIKIKINKKGIVRKEDNKNS